MKKLWIAATLLSNISPSLSWVSVTGDLINVFVYSYSQTPQINFCPISAATPEQLWGSILWRATLGLEEVVTLTDVTETKVCKEWRRQITVTEEVSDKELELAPGEN